MSEAGVRAVVEGIHSSPTQAVLFLSGGASQIIGWLLSVPGSSNTVLETVVPYSRMSMIQLLSKANPTHPPFFLFYSIHCLIFFCSVLFCSRFRASFVAETLLKIWLYWLIIAPSSSLLQVLLSIPLSSKITNCGFSAYGIFVASFVLLSTKGPFGSSV